MCSPERCTNSVSKFTVSGRSYLICLCSSIVLVKFCPKKLELTQNIHYWIHLIYLILYTAILLNIKHMIIDDCICNVNSPLNLLISHFLLKISLVCCLILDWSTRVCKTFQNCLNSLIDQVYQGGFIDRG